MVVSDNASHFTSAKIAEACAEYHIYLRTAMPYHPQENGMGECGKITHHCRERLGGSITTIRLWHSKYHQLRHRVHSIRTRIYGEKNLPSMSIDGNFNRYCNQAAKLKMMPYISSVRLYKNFPSMIHPQCMCGARGTHETCEQNFPKF